MSHFSVSQIKGVIPAMLTPFNEKEELDLNRTRALTAKLLNEGVNGLYLTGSTGEGFLCTADERKLFVETVLEEVRGKIPVIVHVGAISTKVSEELARHAASVGADAVSSVPPIYWKFQGDFVAGAQELGAEFARLSGYTLEDTPYNSSFAGYKDWFIKVWRRPGYTVECGSGQNPLPLSQFEEIYRAVLGILVTGATGLPA